MHNEASINSAGGKMRSPWFFVFWSFIALICFLFFYSSPFFLYLDSGPTFRHFRLTHTTLAGAILGLATASVCTWAFLVCPRRQIVPKIFSFIFLVAGLYGGFASVYSYSTYLVFTWTYGSP
jgi:hypothetical protein